MVVRIAVLPGDDIGPEITDAAVAVLEAADRRFALGLALETVEVGLASYRRHGTTLTEEALARVDAADGVILGPAGMSAYPPVAEGGRNVPGTIRKRLDLYANLRPARARAGVPGARAGLDLLIVRENTEGFYPDRNLHRGLGEFSPTEDCAMSLRVITARGSRRIAERAFELARKRSGHVTVVGKRHVLQLTDGLFFREVAAVAETYPDVGWRELDVDAAAAGLYTNPGEFDVLLTTNMFGDILSNLAAAMAGSLGLAAALNRGDRAAAANAGHGSAPDIAGRNRANPIGLIVSTAMLLDWLGERRGLPAFGEAAAAIEAAVDRALADPSGRTADMGGPLGTRELAGLVCEEIVRT